MTKTRMPRQQDTKVVLLSQKNKTPQSVLASRYRRLVLGLIIAATGALTGCGGRDITFNSNPPGASIEALGTDAYTTTGFSTTPGTYQYNPNSLTGLSYQPGTVQSNNATTYTQSRRIIGYTPLSLAWNDTNNSHDFVTIKKGVDWVVIYVEKESASIVVDFSQDPILVRGARLQDASRKASQDTGRTQQYTQLDPSPMSSAQQIQQASPIPAPNVAPVLSLKNWQMAVNTNPPGAIIQAYDMNQSLYQIGTSPAGFLWPLQTQADALVIIWQGRQVVVLPTYMESMSVDFSQEPPAVKGATIIGVAEN